MLRQILAKLSGLYIGWRMIGVSCAIRVLGGGLHAYGLSVFFLPVTQELGLTRTATSLVFSLARAQGAIEGPIAGYCIDRFGPRPVIAIAVALAGIGYLLLAGVHSYAMLLIVYMGIISLSYQAGFMDATMAVANTWFIRKRALAMSITSGSIALGGALLTPFLAYAVHTWGWRIASIGSGIAFLLAGMPLSLLIRRSPESIGLLPDGAPLEAKTASNDETTIARQSSTATEYTLRETLRTHQFWLLTFATSFRAICSSAVLVHFVPILVWKGYSETQGAFYLGVIAFCGMPTHLLIGWLGDRLYKPRLMAGFMLLGSLSVFLLFRGQANLAAVARGVALQRLRRAVSGHVGHRWRFFRPDKLRQDTRQHEFSLHLGQRARPGDRRIDLRPHEKLRRAVLGPINHLRGHRGALRHDVPT